MVDKGHDVKQGGIDKVHVSMLPKDRLEVTVEFTDIKASIVVSIELVDRTVKCEGAAIVEGLFDELLIMLKLKQRRYYSIGERVISSGIKGLEVTEAFCSDIQQTLNDAVVAGIINGTLRLTKR